MSKTQPQAIKGVVDAVLKGLRNKEPLPEDKLLYQWTRVVKGSLGKHSKPIAWTGTRVIVNVDSSGYLYELNLRKEKILSELKKRLGEEKLDKIQFRLGETDGD